MHPLLANLLVDLVGVEDQLRRAKVLKIGAGREPDGAAPCRRLFDKGQILLAAGVIEKVRLILAVDRRHIEHGPGEAIGRDAEVAVMDIKERFVAAGGIGFLLVTDDVVERARFGRVAGNVVLPGAAPFI